VSKVKGYNGKRRKRKPYIQKQQQHENNNVETELTHVIQLQFLSFLSPSHLQFLSTVSFTFSFFLYISDIYFTNFIGKRFKISKIHVVTPQLLNKYCLGNAKVCNIYIPFPNKKSFDTFSSLYLKKCIYCYILKISIFLMITDLFLDKNCHYFYKY